MSNIKILALALVAPIITRGCKIELNSTNTYCHQSNINVPDLCLENRDDFPGLSFKECQRWKFGHLDTISKWCKDNENLCAGFNFVHEGTHSFGFDRQKNTNTYNSSYGTAYFRRSIENFSSMNDRDCYILNCNGEDGEWSEWGNFGRCNMFLGQPIAMVRTRTCTNPVPSGNGDDCVGDNEESLPCLNACWYVDGGWSSWNYGSCNGTHSQRTRTCSNPIPLNGGYDCVGVTSEYVSCADEYTNCDNTIIWGLDYDNNLYEKDNGLWTKENTSITLDMIIVTDTYIWGLEDGGLWRKNVTLGVIDWYFYGYDFSNLVVNCTDDELSVYDDQVKKVWDGTNWN